MHRLRAEWDESDIEAILEKGDPQELLYVPILLGANATAFEQAWVERVCFKLASHPDWNVRGNALSGIGEIARTRRELDLERAIPLITAGFNDSHESVRQKAQGAACDLHIYLGVVVPGYDEQGMKHYLETLELAAKRKEESDT
jgi:HEAT repeat